MYICICHAISDKQVLKALQSGVDSTHALHKCFGMHECCGSCTCAMRNMLDDYRKKNNLSS